MKKLIFAVALLLSAAGARTANHRFNDPIPECPPACSGTGNVVAVVVQ